MSKKRSIILISVVALITVLFVIASTVFRVNFMSVSVSGTAEKFTQNEIISSSGIERGKSIFFVNKQNAINNIEQKVPYAKVNKIETKFPNKVVFHIEERKELAFYVIDSTYYVVDVTLKVLRTDTTKPELIELSGYGENKEEGSFLSLTNINNVFNCFNKNWQINNGAVFNLDNIEAIDKISKIEYDSSNKTVNFITKEGFEILVEDGGNYTKKIIAVISVVLEAENAIVVNDRINGEYKLVTVGEGFDLTENVN